MQVTFSPIKLNKNVKQTSINNSTTNPQRFIGSPTASLQSYPQGYYLTNSSKLTFKGEEEEKKQQPKKYSVEWAKNWDYDKVKLEFEQKAEDEIERKNIWWGPNKKKVRAEYDALFKKEYETQSKMLLENLVASETKIGLEDARKNAKKAAKEAKEATDKLNRLNDLSEQIKKSITDPNANIDKTIGGYEKAKKIIREKFLIPLKLEQSNIKHYNELYNSPVDIDEEDCETIPLGTTLGQLQKIADKDEEDCIGQELIIKELMIEKYKDQLDKLTEAKLEAENTPIPNGILLYGASGTGKTVFTKAVASEAQNECDIVEIKSFSEGFSETVTRELELAKERYLETGKRTIIVMNEAERYLSPAEKNEFNIAFMKDILDSCSELPDVNKESKFASATTFIFTTNHPSKFQQDEFVLKNERFGVVIPFEPAQGDEMKEVLKLHLNRVNPDEKDFDIENYDYSEIIEMLKPNEEGAFNNSNIRLIIDNTYSDYKRDKSKTFEDHLKENIEYTSRGISAEGLKIQNDYIQKFRKRATR